MLGPNTGLLGVASWIHMAPRSTEPATCTAQQWLQGVGQSDVLHVLRVARVASRGLPGWPHGFTLRQGQQSLSFGARVVCFCGGGFASWLLGGWANPVACVCGQPCGMLLPNVTKEKQSLSQSMQQAVESPMRAKLKEFMLAQFWQNLLYSQHSHVCGRL